MLCTATSVESFITYISNQSTKKEDVNKVVAGVVAKLVFDTCVSVCNPNKNHPTMKYDRKIGKWRKQMDVYPPMLSCNP